VTRFVWPADLRDCQLRFPYHLSRCPFFFVDHFPFSISQTRSFVSLHLAPTTFGPTVKFHHLVCVRHTNVVHAKPPFCTWELSGIQRSRGHNPRKLLGDAPGYRGPSPVFPFCVSYPPLSSGPQTPCVFTNRGRSEGAGVSFAQRCLIPAFFRQTFCPWCRKPRPMLHPREVLVFGD